MGSKRKADVRGRAGGRNGSPLEHQEQVAFMARVDWTLPGVADLIFAIPNGGRRDAKTGAMLKAEGVKAGVPDICVAIPRGIFHGLWIELKRVKGSYASKDQLRLHRRLRDQGYRVELANGAERAWVVLCEYLGLTTAGEGDL